MGLDCASNRASLRAATCSASVWPVDGGERVTMTWTLFRLLADMAAFFFFDRREF
jgi:hypothetical protein